MLKKLFGRNKNKQEKTSDGTPIFRHAEREEDFIPPEYIKEEEMDLMDEHLTKYLGEVDTVLHEMVSDNIHIDVNFIKSKDKNEPNILVTSGMSALPMTVPKGGKHLEYAELMVYLPYDWDMSQEGFKNEDNYWPIYWLKNLARLPHDYKTFLSDGHTIPNGDPQEAFASNTQLSGFVIIPPGNEDEDFETLKISKKKTINYYLIMPLYEEEMDYKLEHGLEALFDKFEEKFEELPTIISPNRENCCK